MSRTQLILAVIALSMAGAVVFLVVSASGDAQRGAPARPQVEHDGEAIVIRLSDGEVLRLERSPMRILPTNASVVDLLTELVPPGRIAAIPEQAAKWSRLAIKGEGFESHPRFARYQAETVLSFQPDLVIASSFNNPDTTARIREAGVPVLRLDIRNDIDDVLECARLLGRLLEADDQAEALCDRIAKSREALRASHDDLKGIKALSYSNLGTGAWTFGRDSTMNELIRLAGMSNAASDKRGAARISLEEILASAPDLIIVGEGEEQSAKRLFEMPELQSLTFVQQRAVVVLPARLGASSSQTMIDGAHELAQRVRTWKTSVGQTSR